jgi:hypothetical protein
MAIRDPKQEAFVSDEKSGSNPHEYSVVSLVSDGRE